MKNTYSPKEFDALIEDQLLLFRNGIEKGHWLLIVLQPIDVITRMISIFPIVE